MGTAAKLTIDLDAKTAGLRTGLNQAKGAIGGFSGGLSGAVAGGLAKFHIGLAAAKGALAAVTGAINTLRASMAQMDADAKFAARIGVSADALAALHFAAEQTGASANTIDTSLQRMTRRLSEAAAGTGEARAALTELGLSATKMAQLSPEQQFATIADAMKGVESQSDKLRLAVKLFDTEGAALLPTLAAGSAGLEEYAKKAGMLGMLMGEDRAKVEEANDAMNSFKKATMGFVAHVVADLAPALEGMANLLTTVVNWGMKLYEVAIGPIVEAISKIVEMVGNGASKMAGLWDIGGKGLGSFKVATEVAADSTAKMTEAVTKAAADAEEKARQAAEALKSRGESLAQSLRTPIEVYRDGIAELKELVAGGAISMEIFRRGASQAYETLKKASEVTSQGFSTPAIAAVTRTSGAFSAVQTANRQRTDEERRHRELLAASARLERAIRDTGITLAPVKI